LKKISIALCLSLMLLFPFSVEAQGTRVFNAPRNTQRLIVKQFAAAANNFTIVNPDPDGTPLTLTSATGRSKMDGNASVTLTNGFTAPVTLTIFIWQQDLVTPANSCWKRVASAAAGYATAADSHYVTVTWTITENTPFLVMSSAAITGNVYTDSVIDPNNNNTVAGY
jgi:hypothetical protein